MREEKATVDSPDCVCGDLKKQVGTANFFHCFDGGGPSHPPATRTEGLAGFCFGPVAGERSPESRSRCPVPKTLSSPSWAGLNRKDRDDIAGLIAVQGDQQAPISVDKAPNERSLVAWKVSLASGRKLRFGVPRCPGMRSRSEKTTYPKQSEASARDGPAVASARLRFGLLCFFRSPYHPAAFTCSSVARQYKRIVPSRAPAAISLSSGDTAKQVKILESP